MADINENQNLTIGEILRYSLEERHGSRFNATAKGNISVVNIDGNSFTDYKAFSFLWEKSYVKEPERSGDGSITNLNSYATFLTPHLKIDFSMMSIDSYRKIMELLYSKNEFIVECYDIVKNKPTVNKMYFATEEMPKLWTIARALNGEEWVELLGVQDYTVELVGTNAELDLVSVVYHSNLPSGSNSTEAESDIYKGQEIIIGKNSSFQNNPPTNYKFKHWVDENGLVYIDGYAYTVNDNLVLYAVWESVEEHTLTFNYGLSATAIDETSMQFINNRKVATGKSIGLLPTFDESPSVDYNDKKAYPYTNGQWWKTPTKARKVDENGNDITETLIVKNNEAYWSNYDSTIYLLYDIKKYKATYYLDGALYSEVNAEYNSSLLLPKLVKTGYTFSGWFIDNEYKTSAPTYMPPEDIILYARFVENK